MIWYDMIWYDMIWYDMIWYDMITSNSLILSVVLIFLLFRWNNRFVLMHITIYINMALLRFRQHISFYAPAPRLSRSVFSCYGCCEFAIDFAQTISPRLRPLYIKGAFDMDSRIKKTLAQCWSPRVRKEGKTTYLRS